jgi:hypothetical protein
MVNGHKYDNDCDESCNVCGYVRSVSEHQFGDYYTVLEPTEDEEGIRSRECLICGEIESEYIEPLGGGNNTVTIIVIVASALAVMAVFAFILISKFR